MKELILAGNWKSNLTLNESLAWVDEFHYQQAEAPKTNLFGKTIIICPPYPYLSALRDKIAALRVPIKLGAQDISPFPAGAYTGEVNAAQLKELVDWVIIGHSERRSHLGENDALLTQKVAQAKEAGLRIMYCVQDETTAVPEGVAVVAYEPPAAIGSGQPDTPENASKVARQIKTQYPWVNTVLYGGSVKPDNVTSFINCEYLSGVLVGGASLKADVWFKLIAAATASTI